MKIAIAAVAASLVMVCAARAETYEPPMEPGAAVCDGHADFLHRTAYVVSPEPQCCSGEIRCTELLSTTVMRLPRRDKRT